MIAAKGIKDTIREKKHSEKVIQRRGVNVLFQYAIRDFGKIEQLSKVKSKRAELVSLLDIVEVDYTKKGQIFSPIRACHRRVIQYRDGRRRR